MSNPRCIRDIVRNYLRQNKYDGLCNARIECACPVDGLMPCADPNKTECLPAKRVVENGEEWWESQPVRVCPKCNGSGFTALGTPYDKPERCSECRP